MEISNENRHLVISISTLVEIRHILYYSWKAWIVPVIRKMFLRNRSSWMCLLVCSHLCMQLRVILLAYFLSLFSIFSRLEDLFLASIEIREFSGIGDNK